MYNVTSTGFYGSDTFQLAFTAQVSFKLCEDIQHIQKLLVCCVARIDTLFCCIKVTTLMVQGRYYAQQILNATSQETDSLGNQPVPLSHDVVQKLQLSSAMLDGPLAFF